LGEKDCDDVSIKRGVVRAHAHPGAASHAKGVKPKTQKRQRWDDPTTDEPPDVELEHDLREPDDRDLWPEQFGEHQEPTDEDLWPERYACRQEPDDAAAEAGVEPEERSWEPPPDERDVPARRRQRARAVRPTTTKPSEKVGEKTPSPRPERPLWTRRPPPELDDQERDIWWNVCSHVDPESEAYERDPMERQKWMANIERLDDLVARRRQRRAGGGASS
jgi:hypothetical protein